MYRWVRVESCDDCLYVVLVLCFDFSEVDGMVDEGDKSSSSVGCPVFAYGCVV